MPRGWPPSKPLTDRSWLHSRLLAGKSTAEIAAEAGCTDRTVRNAIATHGLPQAVRKPGRRAGDIDAAVAAYVAGMGLEPAARLHRVGDERLSRALRERGIELRRRPTVTPGSRYPRLNDRRWLAAQLAAGVPLAAIAREVGCDRQTVRQALRRHRLGTGDVLAADRVWARQRPPGRSTAQQRRAQGS